MICPICESDPCTGTSYPYMIDQFMAGRNVEHWRQIHGGGASRTTPGKYPPLLTQAGTAIKAAAGFVASGGAMVSTEEHDRRRGICADCEHLDAARDRCRKCGCFLAVKPWLAREVCPIGKWELTAPSAPAETEP